MSVESAIKERPILFSGPMVRAILEGRKTVTRRIVNPQPVKNGPFWELYGAGWSDGMTKVLCVYGHSLSTRNPFGQEGDRLWVRETFAPIPEARPAGYWSDPNWIGRNYWYRADNNKPMWGGNWKPSIFMPREACRIVLEIVDISVERLQDMTEEEAVKEGFESLKEFRILWDSLNTERDICKTCKGHGVVPAWAGSVEGGSLMQDSKDCPECHGKETGFGWDANPWVWRIEFVIAHRGCGAVEVAENRRNRRG